MRTGEIAEWLNISSGTVKNWTVEFTEYLSESAQGGDKRRDFTELDVRIMLMIAALRDNNISYDEIHSTLRKLQDEEWSELPQLPERPPGIGPVELMPVSEHESAVNLEKQRLLREIAIRQDDITRLETEIEGERAAHNETRERLTSAREELGELRGKLSTTDARIESIESTAKAQKEAIAHERQRERQLYNYAIIGLLIVSVAVVILVLVLSGGTV